MKIFSVTIVILIATTTIKGQSDRNVIKFNSYVFSTCLTPAHGVYIATRAGEVVVPGDKPGVWQQADPVKRKGYSDGPLIDNINFFNIDTGFVSGFIQDEHGVYNIYYHTTDGGRHWNRRRFADAGWVDKVVHLNNGRAWASIGGSGHIEYSADYGLTWKQISIPHENQRYAAIFFNGQGEGLIGSFLNVLSYTPDNGKTWHDIQTPLQQHAYQKTNIQNRPELNNVAIFQSYLLVEQEGQVFVTPRDSIHWQLQPYYGFIADNNTNTLFFTRKSEIIKVNSDLSPVATYTIDGYPGIGRYNNGQLALWRDNQLTTINENGVITRTKLYTSDTAMPAPEFIGHDARDGIIGLAGNRIYTQRQYGDAWKYKTTLSFELQGRTLQMAGQDTLLVKGPGDSLRYYDLRTGKSTFTTGSALIAGFCSNPVRKIIFQNGSQGCFHHYEDKVIYEREDNSFVLTDNASTGSNHRKTMRGYPDNIESSIVDSFVEHLPAALFVQPAIATIGITAKDIAQCQKDIRAFQAYVKEGKPDQDFEKKGFILYKNNIDFNRLFSLTDSIASMRPSTVDSLLCNMPVGWSTTTNWLGIQLVLDDGQTLNIVNQFSEPNSLHFPWMISVKGYTITKNVVAVNQFIQSSYPAFVGNRGHADIIGHFVKYLYGED